VKLHVLGIDLGKTVFHLVGLDSTGKVVIRKRCSRRQLLAFTANVQVQLIGMESCSGSHFLGRALRDQGHEVRLMPAQYVKPYVQTNKTDYIDAEAIAEAVQRPRMRFVPIKSEEASTASGAGTLGNATHGGGQSNPQPSVRTWIHVAQRPALCGGSSAADLGRCRVAVIGFVSAVVGSAEWNSSNSPHALISWM
jgi:hypothetical protein